MIKFKRPSFEESIKPIWKDKKFVLEKEESPYNLFVATPVHSEVSIHYTQALLEFQKECFVRNIKVTFCIMKSSLVTQGRNLCVADFLASKSTHLLFIDSDIDFQAKSIFEMLKKDKDIISVPYPLKNAAWSKSFEKIKDNKVNTENDLKNSIYQYPIKVPNNNDIKTVGGVIEVTHAPTGCMLIKRSVFDKMIKAYPDKEIVQKTIINGQYVDKPNMWNFFDTLHDKETKTYLGEDFAFCKLWADIGGKCYCYILDSIAHVGEFRYEGRYADELIISK